MNAWYRQAIKAPSVAIREQAWARQQQLTKPPGSLGRLEQLAVTLAALQGREQPSLERVGVVVFAADHGVTAEGISAFPPQVTGEMVRNFSRGGAAVTVLARQWEADFQVVNVGTLQPLEPLNSVVDARIAAGTANFVEQTAMSLAQCEQALAAGRAALQGDWQLFIGGEMGIGNTTSAAALGCALLGLAGRELAGAGTGIDSRGQQHKAAVIDRALALHQPALAAGPLETLAALGGFELAALVGAYIGAAQAGMAVLVDGFICTAAALVAVAINPDLSPWLLFSHQSAEQGHQRLLAALQAEPLLALDLRLGEASGAALCIPLLRSACALHNQMATFSEAGISGA